MTTASRTGVTTYATPTDTEVVITRVVAAPRRLVWDAYTKCEHLRNWMLGPPGWTMPICEVDLRPGGANRYVWRRENGTEMEIRGVFREISAPEKLVGTSSWGSDWPDTLDTLILTEQDGMTTITHTLLYPSKEARDAAMQTGMKDGMDQGFDRLDAYVRTLA